MKRLLHPPLVVTALSALMVSVAACGSSGTSTTKSDDGASAAATTLTLDLTDQGCSPAKLDAKAGKVTFAVTNKTADKAEFEVLSAKPEILMEEFLESGKAGTFAVTLPAGQYQVICGAPSDPRADLVVTGEGGAPTQASATVDPAELAAAVAAYTEFVRSQTAKLATSTKAFTDAVRAGDTATAKSIYAATREPWEQIEPVAELFPDSDAVIDSRADDFEKGEADPGFSGFHAIEYGLWAQGSKDGHAVDLAALATRLDGDMTSLIDAVAKISITPQVMSNGASALIEEAAQTKITGEEERYSRTDLVTLAANVEGARTIVELLRPLLTKADPTLLTDIDAQFATVDAILTPLRAGDGFVTYDKVTEAQRNELKTAMAQLSEELSQISGALGLEVKE